ncbi:uncharacterized protein NPIL_283081 [Nephila pilipes]|uniref:Uncharacterized protein n=1 Tax=Nephila pilipes TaxID=299642 RepID=A0A8X6PL86_NEPPI|nr:uncharacterized protein NPIL_283081 [Nephila pilipes]
MDSMYVLVTFAVTFCIFWGDVKALSEDVESDEFMNALCDPATVKEVARCGELLPPIGKNTIYSCNRNISEAFENSMLQAAETFCEREDIRDWLFLCWEKGLSGFISTQRKTDISKEEEDAKSMNDFQVCLQGILDKLFDE